MAQFTGEAVERLQSQVALPKPAGHLENRGNEGDALTPLQRAQLTAKRVAHSTGEAVERLQGSKLKLDQNPHQAREGPGKRESKGGNAIRSHHHHHTTPRRLVAPDTRKLEHVQVEHDIGIMSPLERAERTAQRVARSTGKSLERLSKSESRLQHSVPLRETTTESESDTSGSECSTTSETRLASLDHGDMADLDRLTSLERVKRTAEIVADSTGVAVQKQSSSLSDSI